MAKKITCENFVAEYARFMRLSVASPPDDLKVDRLQRLLKEHESICSGCEKEVSSIKPYDGLTLLTKQEMIMLNPISDLVQ